MSEVVMPETFRVDPPLVALSPVVYDSPHSGRTYPMDFDHAIDLTVLRQAEDTHVEALFGHVPGQGAPLLYALFPRSYVDVNRAVDDMDVGLIEGEWPLPANPSEFTAQGIGLIWRDMGVDGPIYARKLKPDEVVKRIYFCWRPYHERLGQLIDTAHARFGVSYHINCHSMPSRDADAPEDPRSPRVDFVLGDRDGTSCDGDFVRHVRDTLVALNYKVGINAPYKGAELLRRFGNPAQGRHSLQIEINRRLYMDERTRNRNGYYGKLKKDLESLTQAITAYALDKVGRG
jgi:N-formylglutamate deformylase